MRNRTFTGTKIACYTGYIVQGIINNIAPLLFVIFSDKFNITLAKLSLLITINFATQLAVDTISIKFVDKIGYKPLAIVSQGIAFLGLAIPHLTRFIFKTSDHRILVPAVMLIGMIVSLLCNLVARMPGFEGNLPINAVTAFIGAPIVIWVILRRR